MTVTLGKIQIVNVCNKANGLLALMTVTIEKSQITNLRNKAQNLLVLMTGAREKLYIIIYLIKLRISW